MALTKVSNGVLTPNVSVTSVTASSNIQTPTMKTNAWQNTSGTVWGTVINTQVSQNNTAASWNTSSWVDIWNISYTPTSNQSTIIAIMQLNFLPEASNVHDTYVDWNVANGSYYYGQAKASSISGWFQLGTSLIYTSPNSSTSAQTLRIRCKGNGANTFYFNYNWGPGAARSVVTFLEVAR